MATFSGSAADMLKQYGAAVPDQQPLSSLEEAQAAKAKMEADKGPCTDAGCTEDHSHGHAHSGEKATEAHGHGGHDHGAHDHAAHGEKGGDCCGGDGGGDHDHGHDHHKKAPKEKSPDEGATSDHAHGHGHKEEGAPAEATAPAAPKFEGCAKGKYDWDGTDGGKTAAADGAVGSMITDYAFGDGPKKASVYVDLAGLDDVADADMACVLVAPKRVEFDVTLGGEQRKLTLNHLFSEVTKVAILRKPGKHRVVLKLTKEKPEPWAKLVAAPSTGFEAEEEADPMAGMMGGMGGMPGMGGMGGMDMEAMMKQMGGMGGMGGMPDMGGMTGDAPPNFGAAEEQLKEGEDDLDDLPDLEEDNVD